MIDKVDHEAALHIAAVIIDDEIEPLENEDRQLARAYLDHYVTIATKGIEIVGLEKAWLEAEGKLSDAQAKITAQAEKIAVLDADLIVARTMRTILETQIESAETTIAVQAEKIAALEKNQRTPEEGAATDDHMLEVLCALEDISFECFAPIAPPNRPSLETYNRTFIILDKQRKRIGIHPNSVRGFLTSEKCPPIKPATQEPTTKASD